MLDYPVFLLSNTLKASLMSSSRSVSFSFLAIIVRNSSKSISPLPSMSTSLIMFSSSWGVGFWPTDRVVNEISQKFSQYYIRQIILGDWRLEGSYIVKTFSKVRWQLYLENSSPSPTPWCWWCRPHPCQTGRKLPWTPQFAPPSDAQPLESLEVFPEFSKLKNNNFEQRLTLSIYCVPLEHCADIKFFHFSGKW